MHFDRTTEQPADEMGTLFMVADGMGGAAAGEIASATAVDIVLRQLRDELANLEHVTPAELVGAVNRAAETANSSIFHMAAGRPEFRGMGTTATIVILLGDTLYLAQVGDSRAYLVRDREAIQLTKDQSLMQKLIEAGELTEEEAQQSERRNIILQALGPEPIVRVDITHQRVRRGDVLVMCSDGLSGLVRAEEIAHAVDEEPDLVAACDRLIGLANDRGGPDNITVIAARFDGMGLQWPKASDEVGHRVFNFDRDAAAPVPEVVEGPPPPQEEPVAAAPPPVPEPIVAPPPAVSHERQQRGVLYAWLITIFGVIAVAAVLYKKIKG
jgi:protein phosphatase